MMRGRTIMPGAAMTTRDVTTLIMMRIMNDTHDDPWYEPSNEGIISSSPGVCHDNS